MTFVRKHGTEQTAGRGRDFLPQRVALAEVHVFHTGIFSLSAMVCILTTLL
jgi:hypothetical protein